VDIYCSRCGEPWDLVSVVDNTDQFTWRNYAMVHCPCCAPDRVLPRGVQRAIKGIYAIANDLEEAAMLFEDAFDLGLFDEE